MTDTPRTQAELLSIFADQQNHGITAQDMRDFVVSVGSPVPGGGLAQLAYSPDQAMSASRGSADAIPSATQSWTGAATADYDPASLLQSGTYVSTLEPGTFGPGQWMRLPVGLWIVHTTVVWSDVAAGSYRTTGMGIIDDRGSGDVDDFLYGSVFTEYWANPGPTVAKATLLPSGFHQMNAFIPVTEAMVAASDASSDPGDGWAVACCVAMHDAGSPINVTLANVSAARVG